MFEGLVKIVGMNVPKEDTLCLFTKQPANRIIEAGGKWIPCHSSILKGQQIGEMVQLDKVYWPMILKF